MPADDLDLTSLDAARAWAEAANRHDADAIARLSTRDIQISGPRGSAVGLDRLRDWMMQVGVSFRTVRVFARHGEVVLAQRGSWHLPASDEVTGEFTVATHFTITSGRVARVVRHDSLKAALSEARLTHVDELSPT